jgi:hypothetical protein
MLLMKLVMMVVMTGLGASIRHDVLEANSWYIYAQCLGA